MAPRNTPGRTRSQTARPVAARMEDVAREAGVSLVTVSRVLNTPEKVAPATLAEVRSAIERLRYVPNLAAGSLASNRSRIVAAIVPTIASSIFSDTVDGLAQALAPHRYQLLLGQTGYRPELEEQVIDAFLGRRVDGLMLIGTQHARGVRAKLQRAGIPIVETWDLTPRPVDMLVGFSNHAAGEAAARYLAGKVGGPLGVICGGDERSLARLAGFREAAQALGAGAVGHASVPSPSSVTDGGAALAELLAGARPPRAVFCSNDMIAAGAIFECQRRGIAVPRDIAIMGFADLPIAATLVPALTTVQVRSTAMGQRAGELIMERLTGAPQAQRRVDLGFAVVERASV
jgi:LacI family transcriptional regulator, gluconate utilization system Gnt-I transcriptional repressor